MIIRFSHVTVVVTDLGAAIRFFELFGFVEEISTVISGEAFARFLEIEGVEADHLVLAVPGLSPRFEIQLMHFRFPAVRDDPHATRLDKIGYNHICFAVADTDTVIARLKEHGVQVRGNLDGFHRRRLFFVIGPDGITIELSQAI